MHGDSHVAYPKPPPNVRLMKLFALVLTLVTGMAVADAPHPVRVAVLQFGTVNWELDVINHHALDKKYGVDVQVLLLGSKNAVSVALHGGAADIIVTDWIWVSRMRQQNKPFVFFPYSMTVGALYVRPDSGIESLASLEGNTLGIAGGPVDKSWLLLRAYAKKRLGLDLKTSVEPTFAAPPLLNQLMLKGDLPAVLNFWNYGARLEAADMRPLIGVNDLIRGLGIDGQVPLLGWVYNERWADAHQSAVTGFLRASYAAKQLLRDSDAEWERLRPLTKAEDDDTLRALRDGYRAGIPGRFGGAERQAAAQVFEILAREGGAELVGKSTKLSNGTFWTKMTPQMLLP